MALVLELYLIWAEILPRRIVTVRSSESHGLAWDGNHPRKSSPHRPMSAECQAQSGWWFGGHFFIFPLILKYIGNNHPNWLSYFYIEIYWVANHPNWRNHIFQRGKPTTSQILLDSTPSWIRPPTLNFLVFGSYTSSLHNWDFQGAEYLKNLPTTCDAYRSTGLAGSTFATYN